MSDRPPSTPKRKTPSRRQVFKAVAALGVGTAVFQRAVAAQAQTQPAKEAAARVTPEMIQQAEWIAGIKLTDEQRKATATAVSQMLRSFDEARKVPLDPGVPPALAFVPAPWQTAQPADRGGPVEPTERAAPQRPATADDIAFLPLTQLAALVRTRQVSSVELTRLYLARLEKYDPVLRCVVTLTDDLALKQAE